MYFHQAFIILFSFYSYNAKVLLLDSKKVKNSFYTTFQKYR